MPSYIRRLLLGFVLIGSGLSSAFPAEESITVEVWKGPSCGCCNDWIKHMEENGFRIKSYDTGNTEIRTRLGLATKYGSCHTAKVGGYVVEGHVPARDVRRLLAEKPQAIGIAAPGMPVGSPGMDGPEYGGRKDAHDVLLIQKDGRAAVFHAYR